MSGERIDFVIDAPVSGDLDVRWIHGARTARDNTDPPLHVHSYDEHTFVIRQSMSVHAEAPFLYLLFGNDRALLLDTGATAEPAKFPLRKTVDRLVAEWLNHHPRDQYALVVAHTHAHHDHVAADEQFADRPNTTVVGKHADDVRSYFGFTDWPAQTMPLDLGGRVLEVTGSPGHHEAAITIFDPWSGFLLTGDTVYPGRLYVRDFTAFIASLDRMVEITKTRNVTHVMGCHVEMTAQPRRDYPMGANYQPAEAALPMTVAQLVAVRDAALTVADRPGAHRFDDFIIFNGPAPAAMAKQIARAMSLRIRNRVTAPNR